MKRRWRADIFQIRRIVATVGCAVSLLAASGCGQPKGDAALREGTKQLEASDAKTAIRHLERAAEDLRYTPQHGLALNQLGLAYTRAGETAKAIETYKTATVVEPENTSVRFNLGLLYFQQRDYAKAAKELRQFTDKNRQHYLVFCYLASSYLRMGDKDNATRLYEALERTIPEQDTSGHKYATERALIANGLGVLSAMRGQWEYAATQFQESLKRNPDFAEAHLNLAIAYHAHLGKKAEAVTHYRQFMVLDADSPKAKRVAQIVEDLQKEPTPVSSGTTTAQPPVPAGTVTPTAFQKSVEDLSNQIKTHAAARRSKEASLAALQLGDIYRQRGDSVEAMGAYQAATGYDPANAQALLRLAEIFEAQKDSRALSFYKQAVEIDPSQTGAYRKILEMAQKSGEFDTAALAARRLVERDRMDKDALYTLATLYDQNLRQPVEAASAYQEYVNRFPNDQRAAAAKQRIAALQPPAETPAKRRPKVALPVLKAGDRSKAISFFNEGVQLHQQQQLDAALAQYSKSTQADPTFSRAYFNIGTIHQARGDWEKAIQVYELATVAQSDYTTARLNLALALKSADYVQDAIEQFNRILESDPNEPTAHLGLGSLYARSAATMQLARKHYQRFVELAPTSPAAQEVRRWLAARSER